MTDETLSNLLKRGPPVRAAGRARRARQPQGGGLRPRPRPTARRSGPSRPSASTGTQKWDRVLDWDNPPFAKWFVGGKLNAAYNCVDRHVEAGRGDKVAIHWVGEPEDDTRDLTYAELKDEVCKAANALTELGVRDRRPGRDLPADDPRDRGRDAGLRPDRRPAHRGLRRLLRRRARHPARRLPGARWSSPPTAATAAAPRRRSSRRSTRRRQGRREGPRRREGARRTAYRPGRRVGRRPSTCGGTTPSTTPRPSTSAELLRLRAPALRHVHLRHDRQAEGHPAHDRRLPGRYVVHALGGLRPQARDRRLLVHRRRRLGDRPLLHGLRAARQRRDAGDVRRHARQPRARAAGGRSSRSTRSRSSTPRRPRSGRS